MAGSVGMKNVLRCSIVAGIYETLLEYTFVAGEKRYVAPSTYPCSSLMEIFIITAWSAARMC